MRKTADARSLLSHGRRALGVALSVAVLSATGLASSPPASATGEPQVRVADIDVDEPHAGVTGSMDFPVTLAAPSAQTLTVSWRLAPGKPTYLPETITSGTLVFTPGETSKVLSFPIEFNPNDDIQPYYYTVVITTDWYNEDNYGVAAVHDTTRNGEFDCFAFAYLAQPAGPLPLPGASSGQVGGVNCPQGNREDAQASYDRGHLNVASATMNSVQYADNSVYTQPGVGDGGEAHVRLTGVVWRVAPGLVLRIASVSADARIVCTGIGALPFMTSSSEVKGLSINGAPPLGTIRDQRMIDLGGGTWIQLNGHQDQSGTISGGPQKGEPHRTIRQVGVEVFVNGTFEVYNTSIVETFIGQVFGNPCAS